MRVLDQLNNKSAVVLMFDLLRKTVKAPVITGSFS